MRLCCVNYSTKPWPTWASTRIYSASRSRVLQKGRVFNCLRRLRPHPRLAWSRPETRSAASNSDAGSPEPHPAPGEWVRPRAWEPYGESIDNLFRSLPPTRDAVCASPNRPITRMARADHAESSDSLERRNSRYGLLKSKRSSVQSNFRWIAATILLFVAVTTGAGIVFVTGKIQRERNSKKRITFEEFVSRQRHLSAPKPTSVAPTDINSTTSGASRIGTHTKERAPMPQALPLAPDSVD